MENDDSHPSLYRVMVERCNDLQASHENLNQQLNKLRQDGTMSCSGDNESGLLEQYFKGGHGRGPYEHVLQSIGHAVHVTSAASGEITYWNRSAERLYGWKDYEVMGRRELDFLIDREFGPTNNKIKGCLHPGQSWSGKCPFKRQSGEMFVAIVTKSPLYEDDELVGVITVSSDAAMFVDAYTNPKPEQKLPQIKSVPQIASSVSSLASKLLSKKHRDDVDNACSTSMERTEYSPDSQDARLKNPKTAVANILSKLNIRRNSQNVSFGTSASHQVSVIPTGQDQTINNTQRSAIDLSEAKQHCSISLENDCNECSKGNSGSSHESSCSKADNECSAVDSGIYWEELQLGEEVGQGSYAVVYRGLWNGSDVAIKVFLQNEYNEGTLLGYKKEIDIMRRLRHPNVLLFMGACYSHERLAIVTEFLPRGSLFKTLHRSNQVLDMKRRLRMALDVARGMNYLHRRNPPILHRDLKSSNLLVDKNWTVKVGDFGLSRLKHAPLLSAKSGLGTPQWMAPEILRNEPSNEKSDVFSFGVILWELTTVSIPWNDLNPLQVVGVVGFMDRRLDVPESMDPRVASIIADCWKSKPEQRPSFQDIIHTMTGLLRNVQS